MSTFAQLAALPTPGVAFLLDVSYDDFTTTHYRWGTHSVKVSGNWYDARIAKMGNVARALSQNGGVSGASVDLTLYNGDLIADWLVDRSTFASRTVRASFKLYLALFDPSTPTDLQTIQLGRFSMLDNPQRHGAEISLSLVDEMLGRVGTLATMPSVTDWINATDAARPSSITSGAGASPSLDSSGFNWTLPAPLLFGTGPHIIQRITSNYFLICARVTSGGASPSMTFRDKYGFNVFGTATVTRSAAITKNGQDWRLYWATLSFYDSNFSLKYGALMQRFLGLYQGVFDALAKGVSAATRPAALVEALNLVSPITVTGSPFSQVTNFVGTGDTAFVAPATVANDLLASYALNPISVDATSLANAIAANTGTPANGSIQQTRREGLRSYVTSLSTGDIGDALAGLQQVGRFDVVFGRDGVAYFKQLVQDFATYTVTPTTIAETLMADVGDYVASRGERNSPFTRLLVQYNGTTYGPFVNEAREASFDTAIERTVDASWAGSPGTIGAAIGTLGVIAGNAVEQFAFTLWDSQAVRPMLRFRTTLAAASLELGDYITATWSRGGIGSPYTAAKWRVEGLTLSPENGLVEVVAVWADEVVANGVKPWLLDDESLIVRATGDVTRTITLTSASANVDFSSGSLISDGVAAGDILIVRDGAEAVGSFARNRAYRIASITDADTLVLTENFSGGGTFSGIADWTITRGALTYHTAITDPTNYPSGGVMYGKIADSTHAGKFSDNSTTANTMIDP